MPGYRWQRTIVDDEGNVLPGAEVEFRDEQGGALVSLFTDRDLTVNAGNPITADANGFAFAYMEPARLRITATSGTFTQEWRDYLNAEGPLGSSAPGVGSDLVAYTGTAQTVTEALTENAGAISQRVIYVDSVAELEARTPIAGQQASLSGLRAGIFEFSSSNLSTEVTADPQQGVYIAPDSDATGASGAWVRQYTGGVKVEWFGAVGDGITDDAPAINSALSFGSIDVFFSDSTYLIGSGLSPTYGQNLYGSWRGTIIKVANGANLPVGAITGGDGSTQFFRLNVEGIQIDGNRDNQTGGTGHGIYVYNPLYCTFRNVNVENAFGSGFVLEGNAISGATSFENYLEFCRAYQCNGAGAFFSGPSTDNHVRGGNYGACDLQSIYMGTPSSSIKSVTMFGDGSTPQGVVIDAASVQLQSNEIEGFTEHTVTLTSGADFALVEGNKIYAGAFSAGTSGSFDGIFVEAGCNKGSILNNKVYSALDASGFVFRYALNFAGAHDAFTIYGNDFRSLGSAGADKDGFKVAGILETDNSDYSWSTVNVLAGLNADIAAPTTGAWTKLPYDKEITDTGNNYSLAGTNFTVNDPGLYKFTASALYNASVSGEAYGLSIYVNAAERIRLDNGFSAAAGLFQAKDDATLFLSDGDIVEVRYFVSGGMNIIAGDPFTYFKAKQFI